MEVCPRQRRSITISLSNTPNGENRTSDHDFELLSVARGGEASAPLKWTLAAQLHPFRSFDPE